MTDDNALGRFLRARRQLVDPPDSPRSTRKRRVPGLRREEVATRAGVSLAYYVRLEQGRDRRPSDEVLDALAHALELDGEAARHLQALARRRLGPPASASMTATPQQTRLIERQPTPAYLTNAALDVLAANGPAQALHASFQPGRNIAHDAFLDRDAQAGYLRPGQIQREIVAFLRSAHGVEPDNERLGEVLATLSDRTAHFRHLWERHEVHTKSGTAKSFAHPELGELTLDYEAFWAASAPRRQLVVYQAPDGGGEALLARLAE